MEFDMNIENVPADVLNTMRKKAESEWPDDFSMQKYVLEDQLSGWHSMQEAKATVYEEMKADSGDPDDVSSKILDDIFRKCESEWPEDFAMQKYVYDEEMAAMVELSEIIGDDSPLPKELTQKCLGKALEEWPGDLGMQLYSLKQQLEAHAEMEGLFGEDAEPEI
jgi:capsid portal protein